MAFGLSRHAEQVAEDVVLGVTMPEVLSETFRVADPCRRALSRGPVAHRIDELIDPVMLA